MKLYEKLIKEYQQKHFSLENMRTVIEETNKEAVTKSVIIEHTGTEVLNISKDLLCEVRDESSNEAKDVCDGIIATEYGNFIGYFELKSTCSTNNVLKAMEQISDSQCHWWDMANKCSIDMLGYIEKGIIVTQPITDENRRKAQQRCKRDIEKGNYFSPYKFLLNLLAGKAVTNTTGMPLLYFNVDDKIQLRDIV